MSRVVTCIITELYMDGGINYISPAQYLYNQIWHPSIITVVI